MVGRSWSFGHARAEPRSRYNPLIDASVRQPAPPHLDWEGSHNARDLGGLPTRHGATTLRGRVIRADALDGLTAAGWRALVDYGVRRIIDLREASERSPDTCARPASVATLQMPLDVREDREFWDVWANGPHFGTPIYYRPHIARQPARNAAVLRAIADAAPGGVVFHCQGGRDRTGQIAMLVLALVGVTPEAIAADYALSRERQRTLWAARGEPDQGVSIDAYIESIGKTQEQLVLDALAGLDVRAALADAGLDEQCVQRLRRRLLE